MITALYAALLALMLVWLSARVIQFRKREKVSLGEGGHDGLQRRVRAHANFTEYVPIGLILLYAVEQLWKTPWLTHAIGLMLLIGRALHAHGMAGTNQMSFKPRVRGMVLTFLAIVAAALAILAALARNLI